MQERGSGPGDCARLRKLPLLPNDLDVFDNLAVCNGGPRLVPAGLTVLRAADDTAPIARARSVVLVFADRSGVRRRRTVCGLASHARNMAAASAGSGLPPPPRPLAS